MDARDLLTRLAVAASDHNLDEIEQNGRNDRLTESFRRMLSAFPDVHLALEWVLLEGQRAVGWAHITGTHAGVWRGLQATGRTIDVHGMLAIQLSGDGAVDDFWLVNDWLGIATQLGVRLELPPAGE